MKLAGFNDIEIVGETPVPIEYLSLASTEGKTEHPANVMLADSAVSMKISAIKPV